MGAQVGNGPAPPPAEIRIDTATVKHTMAGGAGALWHAMGPVAYWYKDLIEGKANRNSRGSGWGGNPPLEYTEAWSDLSEHACWLGIVNEPGYGWSWWQGPDGKPLSLRPALHAVRAELDNRGVAVGLFGLDWSSLGQNTPEFDFTDDVVAAFDAHNYSYFPNNHLQKLWADMAHARGIPFFQPEFGDWGGRRSFHESHVANPQELLQSVAQRREGDPGNECWSGRF